MPHVNNRLPCFCFVHVLRERKSRKRETVAPPKFVEDSVIVVRKWFLFFSVVSADLLLFSKTHFSKLDARLKWIIF